SSVSVTAWASRSYSASPRIRRLMAGISFCAAGRIMASAPGKVRPRHRLARRRPVTGSTFGGTSAILSAGAALRQGRIPKRPCLPQRQLTASILLALRPDAHVPILVHRDANDVGAAAH